MDLTVLYSLFFYYLSIQAYAVKNTHNEIEKNERERERFYLF